jgi:high affinity Mn2+ porin
MKTIFLPLCIAASLASTAQNTDSTKNEQFSIHFQATIITQYKPHFQAAYSGENSLQPQKEHQTSITSTLYAGTRLWKGGSAFVNPEIAGGSGLSSALGVASSTNGETFRVGSAEPKIYMARWFFTQVVNLGGPSVYQPTDFNQLAGQMPGRYLSFTIGKVGVADYFDFNSYSHDPREHFMSWGLMNNGAWDYPADVRGYTPSFVAEYITPRYELRYALSMVPKVANGAKVNPDLGKARSQTVEFVQRYSIGRNAGVLRVLGFLTSANMGDYNQSLALQPVEPDITATRRYGNTKYGFGVNVEQQLRKDVGMFFRASWNDGKHETWAFTEIDRSASLGLSLDGHMWKRDNDECAIAIIGSGLSKPHRDYLQAGGRGFMLGDGNLRYGIESLLETYYSAELVKDRLFLTGTYQFLVNPGYNRDRGPAHVFSVRLHAAI